MKKIIFFTLITIYSSTSLCQRTGGNGGGLAEMKFIYVYQNLSAYFTLCLSLGNPCNLTAKQKNVFHQLQLNNSEEVQKSKITFSEKISVDEEFVTISKVGAEVTVSSKVLYKNELPVAVSKMIGIATAARWVHLADGTSKSEILQQAKTLFDAVDEEILTTSLSLAQSFPLLHQFKFRIGSTQKSFLILEDLKGSFDLTKMVLSKLKCENSNFLKLENIRLRIDSKNYLVWADVKSECNESSKLLLIKFTEDKNQFVIDGSISVSIRSN